MSEYNTLGAYRILRTLGEGGMGTVYLGHDAALSRHVAIKVLRLQEGASPAAGSNMTRRFMREARSAARLNHPNVVTIYNVGQSEGERGRPYLVMEYVEGGSLADQLRKSGPLEWPIATRAVRDALSALAAAHEAGIIHRDIKPANLMRTKDGAIKLVDFGLARAAQDSPHDADLTFPGAFVGSPSYASPEQAAGSLHIDSRSDLYSLAATWYTLIAGQPPFVEDDPAEVMRRHLTERFPDLREFAAVPEELLIVMERASRRDPGDRHKSAGEMRDAVDRLLTLPHVTKTDGVEPVGAESSSASRRGIARSPRLEESIHSFESQLETSDPPTRLAALRSLFGLYTQLDRREDATKVFREALALHIKMQTPPPRSLN